jgi:protein-disulfide isomerase
MGPQSTPLGTRLRSALDVVATISIIVASLTLVWVMLYPRPQVAPQGAGGAPNRPAPPPPSAPVSLDGAWTAGSKSAKVVIIEYSDFQCPYCVKVARDGLPEIRKRYVDSGKVLLAFRHLPLEQMHPFALKAAETAECAGEEGKFWEMHDKLFAFANPAQLNDASLRQASSELALGGQRFDSCLAGTKTKKVRDEAKAANSLAVLGTPTFFFGLMLPDGRVSVTQRLSGALPVAQFEQVLDGLLAKVQADVK